MRDVNVRVAYQHRRLIRPGMLFMVAYDLRSGWEPGEERDVTYEASRHAWTGKSQVSCPGGSPRRCSTTFIPTCVSDTRCKCVSIT